MPLDTKRLPTPESSEDPRNYSASEISNDILVSKEGKRQDGRSTEQTRPVFVKAGVVSQAKGSAYIETNNTKLICAVYGPREVTRREEWSMRGQLMCEFKYATFSRPRRQQHQQSSEERHLSALIQQALTPAVCLEKFPKARMDVFITVLEDDGSCLAAALTVASVALADAGIHMYDVVIGAALREGDENMLIDPTSKEEALDEASGRSGCVTVGFMPSLYQTCAFYQTGQLSVDNLNKASKLCMDTCVKLYPVIQNCLVKAVSEQEVR